MADAKSTTSCFLGPLEYYNAIVGHKFQKPSFAKLGAYITFIWSMLKLITFDYIYITFFEHIFKHVNCTLSGLFYRTKKCGSEEIRGGAFIIHQKDAVSFQCLGAKVYLLLILIISEDFKFIGKEMKLTFFAHLLLF